MAAGASEADSSDLSGLDGLELQHGATVRLVSSKVSTEFACQGKTGYQHPKGGDLLTSDVLPQGGQYTVEGVMASAAAPDAVFSLLCDYERVADVFSNVLRSSTCRVIGADTRLQQVCLAELLTKSNSDKIAGCEETSAARSCVSNFPQHEPHRSTPPCELGSNVDLAWLCFACQVCRWEFLVFSGKFPLELTVAEQPEQRRVVFTLASSPFMKSFEGAWQVTLPFTLPFSVSVPINVESSQSSGVWCSPSRLWPSSRTSNVHSRRRHLHRVCLPLSNFIILRIGMTAACCRCCRSLNAVVKLGCAMIQVQERPGGGCSIRHVMAVSPTLSPPRPLAFYTRRVFERQVQAQQPGNV